ncbi:MAG: radical SAM protein [Fimbriimonadaceae bacterium]|nr:radical SAM protein [Fimbriimonadaceae bacterium]
MTTVSRLPVRTRVITRIAWVEPSRLPYGYDDQNIYSGVLFPRAGPKMAAVLQDLGYQVDVISGELSPLDEEELATRYDVVCISVLSNTAPHGLILGRRLVERGAMVVAGGYQFAHQATNREAFATTEEALAFVPYVIRGEGYQSLPALLQALVSGDGFEQVGGLSWWGHDGEIVHNPSATLLERGTLNELPLPDWTVVRDRQQLKVVAVHGMQGCPRECSWCAVWARDGRTNRNLDPIRFVDELAATMAQTDCWHVFFSADNFPARRSWAKAVCEEILARGLQVSWSCQAEVGAARDTELVDLMVRAGCVRWCLGLESINAASLEGSQKRQSQETMEHCIAELHRRGVQIHGMFIVGLPDDDPEGVRRTVAWSEQQGLETVQFLCLVDLPGSRDYETRDLAKRSFRPFAGPYETLNWIFVTGHYARLANELMDLATVQAETIRAMVRFYSLRRALAPLLRPLDLAHWRTARANGRSLWTATVKAWQHNLTTAVLRLRGWTNTRRWLRSPFNKAYQALLSAEGARAEQLKQELLRHLPSDWLEALEEVYTERVAAYHRRHPAVSSA